MFQIIPEQQKCFLILTTAVFHIFILPNLDAAQNLKSFKRKQPTEQKHPHKQTNKKETTPSPPQLFR